MFVLIRRAVPCLAAAGVAAAAGCAHTATSKPVLDEVPSPPSRETRYDVVIELDAETGVAHVTGTLGPLPDRTDLGGEALELRFARRFAFVTLPPRFAEPLTAMADGKLLEFPEKLDEFRFRVDPAGHEQIELRWSIPLDYREDPEVIAGTDAYEHSYLANGHGMLFTGELIPIPEIDVAVATLQVVGDHSEKVLAPWPTARGTEGSTWAPSITELGDDIVLVGDDWRTIETEAQGLTATFAFAPTSVWMEPLVEELLVPIVNAEVELFGWAPRERFLFAFGPAGGSPGSGGSPKSGSMTLFSNESSNPARSRASLAHLIAHEFHHTWGRAGRSVESPEETDAMRHVTEGYTDYYAYLVPWRLGFVSDATFHRTLESRLASGAAALEAYGRSLVQAGGPEFFAGRDAYEACYAGGLVLALWTDLALRRNGEAEGLDALMRDWYAPDRDGRGLEDWEALLRSRLPDSEVDSHMSVITRSGDIDWEGFFDSAGLIVERRADRFEISPAGLASIRLD